MSIPKLVVLNRIIDSGLVAIIRADVADHAARIAEACAKGGVAALEDYVHRTRRREMIETLAKEYKQEMIDRRGHRARS